MSFFIIGIIIVFFVGLRIALSDDSKTAEEVDKERWKMSHPGEPYSYTKARDEEQESRAKMPLYYTMDGKGNINEYTEEDKKKADERLEEQRRKISAMREQMMSDKEPRKEPSYTWTPPTEEEVRAHMRESEEALRRAEEMRKAEARRKEEANAAKAVGFTLIAILFIFNILPIILGFISAFADMESGYYTFFKIFLLIEATVLINATVRTGRFGGAFDAIKTIFIAAMAIIGIASFMNGGFDKDFWVILDIIYALIHIPQVIGLK